MRDRKGEVAMLGMGRSHLELQKERKSQSCVEATQKKYEGLLDNKVLMLEAIFSVSFTSTVISRLSFLLWPTFKLFQLYQVFS